jgi:hypothetical protein
VEVELELTGEFNVEFSVIVCALILSMELGPSLSLSKKLVKADPNAVRLDDVGVGVVGVVGGEFDDDIDVDGDIVLGKGIINL